MLLILINAIKIVFLLGLLVFIHEGGHFLVAKACKIRVDEFALGFGPIIWSKKIKETKYEIRAIPLGGFVNMLGEAERSDEKGSFSKASILKRIAIVIAGGTVNIIFGLIVYFIISSTTGNFVSTTINSIKEGYAAEQIGLQENDKVVKINNKSIREKSDIDEILNETKEQKIVIAIERDNKLLNFEVIPTKIVNKNIGIYLGTINENPNATIKSLYEGSPAKQAGMEEGDIIISVDGQEVSNDAYKIVELITTSKNEDINVVIQRKNEILEFNVNPQMISKYYLGVIFKEVPNNFSNNIYYAFWDTINFSASIIDNLKEMFSGNISADQLMGPVGISTVVAETNKVAEYIYLIALISLSLGITNLLPFPPLDGGKIVILIIEAIRRKPMKESIEIGIQTAGFFIIIGLSIYITYNDILRIF